MSQKKKTSPKQIAANQRNAAKSTGPRTPQGRAVSRMNALKHGILSTQVLVRGLNLRESERELKALHERFWESYQPVGPVEEMLVDQIVTAHWRLRRALTAESGEIALSVDAAHRRSNRRPDPVLQWLMWDGIGDPAHAMSKSDVGNALIMAWLREARDAVEAEGSLSESTVQKLAAQFRNKPNTLVSRLESFRQDQGASSGPSDAAQREKQNAAVLAFLNRQIATFQHRMEQCMDDDDAGAQASAAAAVLPSAETLDKILRYETKLERQLHRAMAQLERIQRMRQGEMIPAPVSVEISDRG